MYFSKWKDQLNENAKLKEKFSLQSHDNVEHYFKTKYYDLSEENFELIGRYNQYRSSEEKLRWLEYFNKKTESDGVGHIHVNKIQEFDNFDGKVQPQDPEFYENYESGGGLLESEIIRNQLHERIEWLSIDFTPFSPIPDINEIGEKICELRSKFKSQSSLKYINMLHNLKNYINQIIKQEVLDQKECNHLRNELKKYNFTLLFSATKLLILASRAKLKVQQEYAPTGKRGLKCIKEYDDSFNKVHKIL